MVKGMGADCVGFIAGLLNELIGGTPISRPSLPPDTAMHYPKGAARVMLSLRRMFMPNVLVLDNEVEPGDVLAVGSIRGGPGHGMIVGSRPNTLWHSNGPHKGVMMTGFGEIKRARLRIFRIYRCDKSRWKFS